MCLDLFGGFCFYHVWVGCLRVEGLLLLSIRPRLDQLPFPANILNMEDNLYKPLITIHLKETITGSMDSLFSKFPQVPPIFEHVAFRAFLAQEAEVHPVHARSVQVGH